MNPKGFKVMRLFISDRGIHLEFRDMSEAQAFYQYALEQGHQHNKLTGTMVILRTRSAYLRETSSDNFD
jgi:hypothetical protein